LRRSLSGADDRSMYKFGDKTSMSLEENTDIDAMSNAKRGTSNHFDSAFFPNAGGLYLSRFSRGGQSNVYTRSRQNRPSIFALTIF
jgi:3'-phosphoadenosine 5'-phosphosulfate sulfotransferase